MIIMKNFTAKNIEINGLNISVATDETGSDWYESQKNFAADSLKIVFNSAGVIVSMSYDVSALWPAGNSIAEIAATDVPNGLDISGGWIFDGKKIIERVYSSAELIAQATAQRDSLLSAVKDKIIVWQTKLAIGRTLTDDEKAKLNAWLDYIDALEAVDTSKVPDITWPDVPA